MTDYQRTTTRETQTADPRVDPYGAPAPAVTTVRTTDSAYTTAGPGGATLAARIVTFAFGILQVLLILRIILLLLVANPGNDVVQLIFNVTQPFVEPFVGMFSLNRVAADQGSVPRHRRPRRAHRLDARRGDHPGRDPDLRPAPGDGLTDRSGTHPESDPRTRTSREARPRSWPGTWRWASCGSGPGPAS